MASDIVVPQGAGYKTVTFSSGVYYTLCQRLREAAANAQDAQLEDDCDYALRVKYLDTLHYTGAQYALLSGVVEEAQSDPEAVLVLEIASKEKPAVIKQCEAQGITVDEHLRRIGLNTRTQLALLKDLLEQKIISLREEA